VARGVTRVSPWWYRHRGLLIAVVYAAGFVIGNISFDNRSTDAVTSAWGNHVAGGKGGYLMLWLAVLSALVAWILRASGTAYLNREVVFASEVQSDRLIVAGPFRFVRNPLYLGNIFLALAIAVLAPPVGFAIIVIGNVVVAALLAGEESKQMAERYGATYAAFRAAVPAFVPRLTAASVPGSATVRPLWGQALVGEAFCLMLGIAIVPLALFRAAGATAFWAICIPTFLVFTLWGWWTGRARSARA
jgi:hypothetical protein